MNNPTAFAKAEMIERRLVTLCLYVSLIIYLAQSVPGFIKVNQHLDMLWQKNNGFVCFGIWCTVLHPVIHLVLMYVLLSCCSK